MHEQIARVMSLMERERYVGDRDIATAVYLAMELEKPLLIEGEAGVGKTEVAKVLAAALGTNLIRLQCYEGLDAAAALYEWNYAKQLLRIKMEEGGGRPPAEQEAVIFSEAYLLRRPLLAAISQTDRAPVLLIDEVDRADEEFEAFCLEVLSDFQVTIPELGTIRATHRPHVVLTSNRTRSLSDALRRRCLYLWIDYPSFEKEVRVVRQKVPACSEGLAHQIAGVMQVLRRVRLGKTPGVAETLDWALALAAMHRDHLDRDALLDTLGCFVKDPDDLRQMRERWIDLLCGHILQGADQTEADWRSLAERLEAAAVR